MLDGTLGAGFTSRITRESLNVVPKALRKVADAMEEEIKEGKYDV